MAAPAQTTSDVPEPTATADPIALAAFVSRRAGRVLAYLDAVTAPSRALDAAAETFASYRVARAADPDAEAPATTLLRATRRAAAAHAENPLRPDGRERPAARTNACAAMPRLLIAWTESRLPEADVARLVEHLQGCPDCRALRDAFDRAELGYRAGESTDPDATEVGVITTAMARAGGAPAPVAALPRDEATPSVDGPRSTPASEPTSDATPAEAPGPATRGDGDADGDGRSSRVPPRDRRPAGRSSLPESPARPATDGSTAGRTGIPAPPARRRRTSIPAPPSTSAAALASAAAGSASASTSSPSADADAPRVPAAGRPPAGRRTAVPAPPSRRRTEIPARPSRAAADAASATDRATSEAPSAADRGVADARSGAPAASAPSSRDRGAAGPPEDPLGPEALGYAVPRTGLPRPPRRPAVPRIRRRRGRRAPSDAVVAAASSTAASAVTGEDAAVSKRPAAADASATATRDAPSPTPAVAGAPAAPTRDASTPTPAGAERPATTTDGPVRTKAEIAREQAADAAAERAAAAKLRAEERAAAQRDAETAGTPEDRAPDDAATPPADGRAADTPVADARSTPEHAPDARPVAPAAGVVPATVAEGGVTGFGRRALDTPLVRQLGVPAVLLLVVLIGALIAAGAFAGRDDESVAPITRPTIPTVPADPSQIPPLR